MKIILILLIIGLAVFSIINLMRGAVDEKPNKVAITAAQ